MVSSRSTWLQPVLLASFVGLVAVAAPPESLAQVLVPGRGGTPPAAASVPAEPQALEARESPVSLTASDGSGLQLVSYKARSLVEDPLAFTELSLVFHNPEPRQREGRFRITLPPGATVSRFAMKVGGRLMEGEVVERQAARRAYEDFLHRRQDPALLENEAGNEFSARVFPIPPGGDKELILSYSQELPATAEPFRLPLRGLPTLGELDLLVSVHNAARAPATDSNLGGSQLRNEVIEVQKRNYRPDRDLEVARRSAQGQVGLRHDNLVVARVQPVVGAVAEEPIRSLLVLVDTSASRALGFEAELTRLSRVLARAAAGQDFRLQVMAFDQDAAWVYSGRVSGWGDDDVRRLLQRRAEGASNLQQALERVAERYRGQSAFDRLLIVSDGVVTAGSAEGDELRAQVARLEKIGITRADVLAVGGIRDDARLALLARAGLAHDGMVLGEGLQPAEAGKRLRLSTRSGITVSVPGARWSWPEKLDGVQPGDEVLVYADLPRGQPLRIDVGGKRLDGLERALTAAERPLLERAWVKARIARLSHQRDTLAAGDADMRQGLSKQIVELSTRFRVLCDDTALLVLETEDDYARFGIERRALADILTLGPTGLEVLNRAGFAPLMAAGPHASDALREPLDGSAAKGRAAPDRRMNERSSVGGVPEQLMAAEAASEPADDLAAAPMLELEAPRELAASPDIASGARPAQTTNGGMAARSRAVPQHAPRSPNARPAPAASAAPAPTLGRSARNRADRAEAPARVLRRSAAPARASAMPALSGALQAIDAAIRAGQRKAALAQALAWRERDPGDVLGIVGLGRAQEALGKKREAARTYGSIIDLFPARADLRRFAAGYLERLQLAAASALALDSLERAALDRPDHPSSHHLLAMALLKRGRPEDAFAAIERALTLDYPSGRFRGVDRILREDLGLCAAAWAHANPQRRAEIERRLHKLGGVREDTASVRFVLTWETDANDVDFHIRDARGGHAYYSSPHLPSGGELYADVTTGYGPECFTVREPQRRDAGVYRLQAHYYSKGPMGYGMGRLEIIEHDAHGNLRFETRPFVVMNDGAFLDLGRFRPDGAALASR